MLTLIIGIVVCACLVGLRFWVSARDFSDLTEQFLKGLLTGIIAICMLVSISIGLYTPVSGYNEPQVCKKTELVSLSDSLVTQGSGLFYVSVSADNVYSYRYEIESEFGTASSKEYKVGIISYNVTEIEDPNCTVPMLITYETKAKSSIWTFALCKTHYDYVFYVPEGTIQKDITLN